MLLKPTFTIPHGGGKRFAKDSLEYRVIEQWIAAGAPAPAANDPEISGLEVFPAAAVLAPGAEQQIVVRARYSDGHSEDVTRWVKFSSSNEGVATVDDFGLVKMIGCGRSGHHALVLDAGAVFAADACRFANQISAEAYEQFPRHNFIDDLVAAKWKGLHLAPSKPADDATFMRRAYLDAAGMLPTAEEVENFLADKSPDKRAKLVDRLMSSERVRRLLGVQVVRPAAGLQPQAELDGHVVVLRLDPRLRGSITSRGTSSPARSSCFGQHARARRAELFRPAQGPHRAQPRMPRRRFSASASPARAATTIRSRSGRRSSITRWPICSRASG